jgi:hypothetical protein
VLSQRGAADDELELSKQGSSRLTALVRAEAGGLVRVQDAAGRRYFDSSYTSDPPTAACSLEVRTALRNCNSDEVYTVAQTTACSLDGLRDAHTSPSVPHCGEVPIYRPRLARRPS